MFRPHEPAWVNKTAIERVRKTLVAYDPLVNLHWGGERKPLHEMPGRWKVVEWLRSLAGWDVVFYVEGEGGSYIEPCSEYLLRRLCSMRIENRFRDLEALADDAAAGNAALEAEERSRMCEESWDEAHDRAVYTPNLGRGVLRHESKRKSFQASK